MVWEGVEGFGGGCGGVEGVCGGVEGVECVWRGVCVGCVEGVWEGVGGEE